MRTLIDTCVVIDVLQHREPFWKDAYAVFMAIANRHVDGFLSAKSITDIYYLTHRATHDNKETRKILTTLLSVFDLLDTAGMDCRRALSSDISDYEDAVMIETAARSGVDCIVTRNLKDYSASPIPVYAPAAFLEMITPDEE